MFPVKLIPDWNFNYSCDHTKYGDLWCMTFVNYVIATCLFQLTTPVAKLQSLLEFTKANLQQVSLDNEHLALSSSISVSNWKFSL